MVEYSGICDCRRSFCLPHRVWYGCAENPVRLQMPVQSGFSVPICTMNFRGGIVACLSFGRRDRFRKQNTVFLKNVNVGIRFQFTQAVQHCPECVAGTLRSCVVVA